MRDVLDDLMRWWQAGAPIGMATVVGTWKSAPRQPGATMLVGPDGTAVGSVSGGCVEAAVYELCQEAIATGKPVVQRYGISDDDAFAVGLTCGGIIDLLVERIDRETFPELDRVAAAINSSSPAAVLSVIEGPDEQIGRRMVLWPHMKPAFTATLSSSRSSQLPKLFHSKSRPAHSASTGMPSTRASIGMR